MSDPVSRETPPTPEAALGVFSRHLDTAEQYAHLLSGEGVLRGLIGPREVPRLWERHLINCALLGEAVDEGLEVCDLGSGAGLPGLVLALNRPDLQVTLVEPLLRRTTFLQQAVQELGLTNVEVVRARAEELHGARDFDVVTSRAVAPLERLLGWSMPLVRRGGALVAMKGSSVRRELEEAAAQLQRYGAGAVSVTEYGSDIVDQPTILLTIEATRDSARQGGTAGRQADARPGDGRRNKTRRRKK